jgi:hypothetical protein
MNFASAVLVHCSFIVMVIFIIISHLISNFWRGLWFRYYIE